MVSTIKAFYSLMARGYPDVGIDPLHVGIDPVQVSTLLDQEHSFAPNSFWVLNNDN